MKLVAFSLIIALAIETTAICYFVEGVIETPLTPIEKSNSVEEKRIKEVVIGTPSSCLIINTPSTVGFSNNNPGNIKRINGKWKGQIGIDKFGHVIFSEVEWGLRAMVRVLKNYYLGHKLNTIEKILDSYVVARTEKEQILLLKYKTFISRKLGIGIKEPFNVLNRIPELMSAIVYYENGYNPYPFYMFIIAGLMEDSRNDDEI